MKLFAKKVRYFLEGIAIYTLYYFFKLFSLELASKISSTILGLVGYLFIKENDIAKNNLSMCFPHWNVNNKKKIIINVWKHFGSIIGEISHWKKISSLHSSRRIKIVNKKNIPYKKSILVSGHLGNWELISKIAKEYNIKMSLVYRPANNPYVNNLINKIRKNSQITLIPKGLIGVKSIS